MAWYEYTQNNTGGSFVEDDRVGSYVWVEAASADEANSRAEGVGIYFDGCDNGMDCSCCGDRWYPVWKDDGSDKPELYGKRVTRRKGSVVMDGFSSSLHEGTTLHLYYKNGTHERIYTQGGKVTGHARD
jgi:hypothetical protein